MNIQIVMFFSCVNMNACILAKTTIYLIFLLRTIKIDLRTVYDYIFKL